jgi:uncharacterized protein (TIGR02996 family)
MTDLSPSSLQELCVASPARLLETLRAQPSALASLLATLCEQHQASLEAAPEQFALQMRARLPHNEVTREWLQQALPVERTCGLSLRSRTLRGPSKVELWRARPHSALVHAMVVLPDGDTVVSAGEDGRLLRWSASGRAQKPVVLEAHRGPVNHLALSPDRGLLATAGDDHRVGLWEVLDGDLGPPRMFEGHTHYVRQVALAQGVLVSVSQDGTARIYHLPEGELAHVLEHGQDVMSLALSPDGRRLATTTINSALHLWDVQTGQKISQLYGNDEQVIRLGPGLFFGSTNRSGVGHKDYPHALGFLPDGSLWSMGSEWIVWDTARGREALRHPQVTRFAAEDVCWLDDERVAVADRGVLILRVLPDCERLATLGIGLDRATALCLLPDGLTLLSAHHDGTVCAWDLSVASSEQLARSHHDAVWQLIRSPSGRYAVSRASDDSVCVWDTRTGALRDTVRLAEPNSYGHWFAFSRDETRLALGESKGFVHVRALDGGEPLHLQIEHEKNYQAVGSVCFGPDPDVLFAGLNSAGLFRISLPAGQSEPFVGYAQTPMKQWCSEDGQTLVTEDNFPPNEQENWQENTYQLLGWDTGTLQRRWRVTAERGGPGRYITFGSGVMLPQGLVTETGQDARALVLRDLGTGAVLRTVFPPAGSTLAPTGGPRPLLDGRWWLDAEDPDGTHGAALFDPRTGEISSLESVDGWVLRALSADGRLMARTRARHLEVIERESGLVRGRFFADHDLTDAAFADDGSHVMVADRGGMIHALELLEPAQSLPQPHGPVPEEPVLEATGLEATGLEAHGPEARTLVLSESDLELGPDPRRAPPLAPGEGSLLRAISRQPRRDEPRRAWADWLASRGDPRGEFVHAQCDTRSAPRISQRSAARRRAEELLREHREQWLLELGLDPHDGLVTFVRGLVHEVELDAERWMEAGPELVRRAPVRVVSLREARAEHVQALAGARWMRRVRELRIEHGSLGDEGVASLFLEGVLPGLRSLSLAQQELGLDTVRALVRCGRPWRALDLSRNRLGDEAAHLLAGAPSLGSLRGLVLYDCGLSDEGARALAGAPFFRGLRRVNLYANPFGPSGIAALREAGLRVSFWAGRAL